MRYARLCIHDEVKGHYFIDGQSVIWLGATEELAPDWCPGGEFLADDALILEKVDGEWPDNAHLVARRWKASNDGTHYLFQRLLTDALTVREGAG